MAAASKWSTPNLLSTPNLFGPLHESYGLHLACDRRFAGLIIESNCFFNLRKLASANMSSRPEDERQIGVRSGATEVESLECRAGSGRVGYPLCPGSSLCAWRFGLFGPR
ncbi:hypothetical protein GH714_008912 [Hevea brasiliensis]|uniref:Uncharacterized protein n=1 Tax=Hevea brasiliensis TaxID=3981 RepID=A0A6A6KAQ8_HEVBR|nr:hypothetical protein GH714_008912 [Hevea brasiliensis]